MENERTPEDIFLEMTQLCAELGWLLAMNESDDGSIHGVVVGTGEFVVETVEQLTDGEQYSIYQHGPEEDKELH